MENETSEIFEVIAKVKHKGENFYVLLGNELTLYFIKQINENEYMCPTKEEYEELYKEFRPEHSNIYNMIKFKPFEKLKIDVPKIIHEGKTIALAIGMGLMSLTNPVETKAAD